MPAILLEKNNNNCLSCCYGLMHSASRRTLAWAVTGIGLTTMSAKRMEKLQKN